jgi:hypothetical protein
MWFLTFSPFGRPYAGAKPFGLFFRWTGIPAFGKSDSL